MHFLIYIQISKQIWWEQLLNGYLSALGYLSIFRISYHLFWSLPLQIAPYNSTKWVQATLITYLILSILRNKLVSIIRRIIKLMSVKVYIRKLLLGKITSRFTKIVNYQCANLYLKHYLLIKFTCAQINMHLPINIQVSAKLYLIFTKLNYVHFLSFILR